MITYNQPKWWTKEYDSAWNRAKAAFKRDWDQTKHDFGGNVPDTNQQISDTIKQAAGKEEIPPRGQVTEEEAEYAYRYGYGARMMYGQDFPEWDTDLEARLEEDWDETNPDKDLEWERQRDMIRAGWLLDKKP